MKLEINFVPDQSGMPLNGSASISVTARAAGSSPRFLFLEATNPTGFDVTATGGNGDPALSRISYAWVIQTGGATSFGAPNLVTGWNNARYYEGFQVALMIPTAGETITGYLYAVDASGNEAVTAFDYTAGNADTAFPTTATICLDPSGTFTGAPSGATQVTTVGAMQTALDNRAGAATRILIARGSDISNFSIDDANGSAFQYLGAFGTGAKPIIRPNNTGIMIDFYQTAATLLQIDNIDMRGHWDDATETGFLPEAIRGFNSSLQNILVSNCDFSGFELLHASFGSQEHWFAMADCTITNWSSYGIYQAPSANAILSLTGCDLGPNEDALNDSQTTITGPQNTQGPIRFEQYGKCYIGQTSIFSRFGWFNGNDQPCLRLIASGDRAGARTVLDRVVCEGGINPIYWGLPTSGQSTPGNHIADKVLCIAGGGRTGQHINGHWGGSTLRNIYMVQLDVARQAAKVGNFSTSINLVPSNPDGTNNSTQFDIRHCTTINLRSAANDTGDTCAISGTNSFSSSVIEKNVAHGPTLDTPVNGAVTLDGNIPGYSTRHRGIRAGYPPIGGTFSSGSATIAYPSGTNQAYWQATEAAGDTLHHLVFSGTKYAALGDFSVTFNAGDITVTGNAGWNGSFIIMLDRKSTLQAGFEANTGNPTSIPLYRSNATADDTGRRTLTDFLGNPRPGASENNQDYLGNALAATGDRPGAILPAGV